MEARKQKRVVYPYTDTSLNRNPRIQRIEDLFLRRTEEEEEEIEGGKGENERRLIKNQTSIGKRVELRSCSSEASSFQGHARRNLIGWKENKKTSVVGVSRRDVFAVVVEREILRR